MTYALQDYWPKLEADVSRNELKKHVEALMQWERYSGTYGEYQAVAYVKDRLDDFGIDAKVEEFDGLISNNCHASVTIHAGDRRVVQCLTHPFSVSAPGGMRAEVAYAGTKPGDVDVAGKIAIVDGPGTPWDYAKWRSLGAVAIICHSRAKVVQDYIISGVWGTPEPSTAPNLPDVPVVSIDSASGDYLRSLLREGRVEVTVRTLLDTGIKDLRFPVAEIKGDPDSEEFVLIAGHMDSWYFGAQDNAAGNSSLLELARVLQKHREKLKRNVRVAWWIGHSHGRFAASTWYCDNYWEDLARNCVGYLNVDQPGHRESTWMCGFATPDSARYISGMIKTLVGQDRQPPRPPRNADQSFWGVGLPSFSYLPRLREGSPDEAPDDPGGRKPWYQHTPHDTIDKLDFDLLRDHTYYFCATMMDLSNRGILPWDHADTADAFAKRLSELNEAGGTHLDLAPCFEQAAALKRVAQEISGAQGLSADRQSKVSRGLLRASQILLNIYYTEEGKYHQPNAIAQPFLPGLSEVGKLAQMSSASEPYLFLKTKLIRERNRVTEGLRWAEETIRESFE